MSQVRRPNILNDSIRIFEIPKCVGGVVHVFSINACDKWCVRCQALKSIDRTFSHICVVVFFFFAVAYIPNSSEKLYGISGGSGEGWSINIQMLLICHNILIYGVSIIEFRIRLHIETKIFCGNFFPEYFFQLLRRLIL